jgi:hypothetical protein
MTDEGYVEISGVPDCKYPLVKFNQEDFDSADAHTNAFRKAVFDGKMVLCAPTPEAFWLYVRSGQMFTFADGYEAIVGAGVYLHQGAAKLVAIYDVEKLMDTMGYVSKGSKGEEVGDDYAEKLLASLRRQGSPETCDSIGLRFK